MLDWDVAAGDEGELPPEPREATPRHWRWRPLALLVLLVLIAGMGLLRWRMVQQERLIRADLLEVIRQEERVRAAGQPAEARTIAVRDAPREWMARYLATFEPSDQLPRERHVALGDIEAGRGEAIVEVLVDGDLQLRAYHRQGGRWRRAPLPEDALGREAELQAGPATIRFRARDRTFASLLAEDVGAWGTAAASSERPAQVVIGMEEFGPPVGQRASLWINSPLVVGRQGGLDGIELARLSAAYLLWPLPRLAVEPPRNARLMQWALREVVVLSRILPADTYAAQVAAWRTAALDGQGWQSPFFAPETRPPTSELPWQPDGLATRALVTAAFLLERDGSEQVVSLMQASARRGTWDPLFQRLLGRYTAQVENELRADLGLPLLDVVVPARLPTTVYRGRFVSQGGESTFVMRPMGDALGGDIVVDDAGATIAFTDGSRSAPRCLPRHPEMRVEGDWSGPGRTLLATRVAVEPSFQAVAPPLVEPTEPPLLYIADGPVSFGLPDTLTIRTLQPDGTVHTLLDSSEARLLLLPVATPVGQPVRFLLAEYDYLCSHRHWAFYLYEAEQGIVASWVVESSGVVGDQAIWDDGSQSLSLVYSSASQSAQALLVLRADGEASAVVQSVPVTGSYFNLVGITSDPRRAVLFSWDRSGIALLDLESLQVTTLDNLAPDGNRSLIPLAVEGSMLYLSSVMFTQQPATTYSLDLDSSELSPFTVQGVQVRAMREGSEWLAVFDESEGGPKLALTRRDSRSDVRRVILGRQEVVAASSLLLCGTDSLVFEYDGGRLYRWTPDGKVTPLGDMLSPTSRAFACP